jgi:hypothetical protein
MFTYTHSISINTHVYQQEEFSINRIRDSNGVFFLAHSEGVPYHLPTLQGEVKYLLKTDQWTNSLQLNIIIFELDYKVVVDHINHPREDNSIFGTIIKDKECTITLSSFVRKQIINVVHSLVKATMFITRPRDIINVHLVLLLCFLIKRNDCFA